MPPPGGLEDPPVDGGYTGRLVEWAKEKLALVVKVVKRSDDVSGFVVPGRPSFPDEPMLPPPCE